jgi:hypothetical protein
MDETSNNFVVSMDGKSLAIYLLQSLHVAEERRDTTLTKYFPKTAWNECHKY